MEQKEILSYQENLKVQKKKKKRKKENGNSKETASTVEDSPQDAETNDSKRHSTLDGNVKNIDSSCDSQMIPGNQLGFPSPSSSNKRSNADNMTKSDRNVKGKFSNV